MGASTSNLYVNQLFDRESCTYTYLLGDRETKEAVLIDPVIELVDRDLDVVRQNGFQLKYALNTHVHADHITGTGMMKAKVPGLQSVLGKEGNEDAVADVYLTDGEVIKFGAFEIEARATPGHTNGCHTYVLKTDGQDFAFTGDTLLIGGCGRTDFQQGDSSALFDSVHNKIFNLEDSTIVFPAHDYKGRTQSTVGLEKKFNARLNEKVTKREFVEIMSNLNLPFPKKIEESLPMNKVCGVYEALTTEDKKIVDAKRNA